MKMIIENCYRYLNLINQIEVKALHDNCMNYNDDDESALSIASQL